ncbi:MAG: translocation/assembly module TamB domain-containing protein [Sphaerochaetaceae bacterium]|nr:translocation/assembly module TamB domain-containing protein [Spirochaetales bacterium]MDY5499564.1 translocation/assembly module TamB domain-containing protein [Sphaerochaetaceae bacterium]
MKYHTTRREIVSAAIVTAFFVALSWCAVMRLHVINPAHLLSEKTFAGISQGSHGKVELRNISRKFFFQIHSDDVDISYDELLDIQVDSITFQEGLLSLMGKLASGVGTPTITVTHPHGLVRIPENTRQTASSENPEPTEDMSPVLKRLGWRVSAAGIDLRLVHGDFSVDVEGGNLDFLVRKGGRFGSVRLELPQTTVSSPGFSLRGSSVQFYFENSGFLYTRFPSVSGKKGDIAFAFDELRAESRITSGKLPISLSLRDLSVTTPQYELKSPLLSGTFLFGQLESNLLTEIEIPDFESGELSLSQLEFSSSVASTSLPASTIAITHDGVLYHAAFAINDDATIRIEAGDGSLDVTGLKADGSINTQSTDVEVALGAPHAAFTRKNVFAELSNVQANANGSRYSVTEQSIEGQLHLAMGSNTLDTHISMRGGLSGKEYAATGILSGAGTNLFGRSFEGTVGFHWDFGRKQGTMQFGLNSGSEFHLDALLEQIETGKPLVTVNAALNGLPLIAFDQTWQRYLPLLTPYYDGDTTAEGNFYLHGGSGEEGQVQYDISLADLKFGQFRFRAGSTGRGSFNDTLIDVGSITIGVQDYRLEFEGDIEVGDWVPSGTFLLSNTENGNQLLRVDMLHVGPRQYRYTAISDQFTDFQLSGSLESHEDLFSSAASLVVKEMRYPVSWQYTISTQRLEGSCGDMVSLVSDIKNPLSFKVSFNNLQFPSTKRLIRSFMSGSFDFLYTSQDDWSFQADNFSLSGIQLGNRTYTFQGDGSITPDSFEFTNLTAADGNTTFSGAIHYQGTPLVMNIRSGLSDPFTLAFHMNDGGVQGADIYVGNYDDRMETMVDIRNLDLDRFLPEGGAWTGNLRLIGSSGQQDAFRLAGTVDIIGNDSRLQGTVGFDGNLLTISHLSANAGPNRIDDASLSLDLHGGQAVLDGSFFSDVSMYSLEPRGSSALFHLAVQFAPFTKTVQDILPEGRFSVEQIRAFLDSNDESEQFQNRLKSHFLGNEISVDLGIRDLVLLGSPLEGLDGGADFHFSYLKGRYSASGSIINGYFDDNDKSVDLTINPVIGFGGHLAGSADVDQLALKFSDAYLDLRLINRFFATPIFMFQEGVLKGTLYADGNLSDPNLFGQLSCDSLDLWNFYVPDYDILVKNVLFSVDSSELSTVRTKCFAVRHDTGETVEGQAQLNVQLDGIGLAGFNVTVWLPDKPIEFYCPVPEANVEVSGFMKGWFRLNKSAGSKPLASGEATVSDVLIGIGGMRRCPDWYKAANISVNFLMTNGTNNRIIYPNTDYPMLSFTLKEDESFRFRFDNPTKTANVDGTLVFRNGDIFYFQKDFYVTEGSMALRTSPRGGVQPFLNLRARLRDFDADGNPVDIYLVLADSTLDNLNPTFESIPAKSTEEIMSILGGSILPGTEEGGMSLYRVASVATMATDVAERLGWIQSSSMTNLSETIRNSLRLDVFSFRSQIMQNFLIDALPGSDSVTISPLARYLNNTSVFIGKYLADDMFLQAMLHLSAVNPRSTKPNDSPFLVNDLSLQFELSFEWENPLCTFTVFSQPNELSLIDFLDTIGLSVTKRIVLF